MTRDHQLKALRNKKASKEQLREALAASLGVEYEPETKEKAQTLFTQFRNAFSKAYKEHTKIDYSFGVRDGVAIKQLIEKIQCLIEYKSPADALATFEALLLNLPDWYKQNAFSLSVINSKFNEIVASIRKNGRQQQSGGNDLESKLAERFRARQPHP